MILINETKLNTTELRNFLYSLSKKARISTSGVRVTIKYGKRLRGWCNWLRKEIAIYITPQFKIEHISHVWVHELAHLTIKNIRLYRERHPGKAQTHADRIALRVTGVSHEEVNWGSPWYIMRFPWASTYKGISNTLKEYEGRHPKYDFRVVPGTSFGRKGWRLEYKLK